MVVVMLGFYGFTKVGIPLINPAPPPVEEKISGDITMDQFVALGEKIFNGKGTCTLCHNSLGRAPMLEPVATVAMDRIADPRYGEKGKATTIGEYIYESMIDPSAFVVGGFGKKGSNDTVSPMPNVSTGAIGLSAAEMDSVIAFLQSTAGVDITVSLPTGEVEVAEEGGEAPPPAESAKEAFSKFGCDACHMGPEIEEGGDMGPDLSKLAATAGKRTTGLSAVQFIVNSIVEPNAVIAEGFDEDMMPDDFAEQMTVSELNLIVNAILGKK